MKSIRIYVGYDAREAVAYHVCCQSIIENCSIPVEFIPLNLKQLQNVYSGGRQDGSNDFIYSRFLVPYLDNYQGWSLFIDSDIILEADLVPFINDLDETKAVYVVKHDYKTKFPIKYLGNKNDDYPRKNWTSVIIFNNSHKSNKALTPDLVNSKPGSYLHRLSWLRDDEIGSLPLEMNYLELEYPEKNDVILRHFTIGTPCFKDYRAGIGAKKWNKYYNNTIRGFDDI